MIGIFRDREEAGRKLGEELALLSLHDPLVLGIPRGGVVTAAAIARLVGGELDVVLAHKIGHPNQPELAIGAVGEDGQVTFSSPRRSIPGVATSYVEDERRRQIAEIDRRRRLFRSGRAAAPINGRSVILTDDGVATGSTMFAAIDVVRSHDPRELIVAVPVAPADTAERLRDRCDRFICLQSPEVFWAVGEFYASFRPVSDDRVVEILCAFNPSRANP